MFVFLIRSSLGSARLCGGALGGRNSNYLTGDILRDRRECVGPDGEEYPHQYIANMIRRQQGRAGRALSASTMGERNRLKTTLRLVNF